MTDTIPTLAHAVRIGSDLSLYRERERAELIISHASGGVLVELVDRRDYERERDELKAECARLRDGLQLIACEPINAESMASNVLAGLPAYHDTILAPEARPAPASAPERAEPALEVRACGCSQAKAGRCVMGDYGALPIGTQLYAGRVPEPTDIEAVLRDAVDRAVDQCADTTGQRKRIALFVNRTEIVNAAIAQIRGDSTCPKKGGAA